MLNFRRPKCNGPNCTRDCAASVQLSRPWTCRPMGSLAPMKITKKRAGSWNMGSHLQDVRNSTYVSLWFACANLNGFHEFIVSQFHMILLVLLFWVECRIESVTNCEQAQWFEKHLKWETDPKPYYTNIAFTFLLLCFDLKFFEGKNLAVNVVVEKSGASGTRLCSSLRSLWPCETRNFYFFLRQNQFWDLKFQVVK